MGRESRRATQASAIRWWVGGLLLVGAIVGGGFAVHSWAPGLWAELSSDSGIASAIVSVLGALIGTLIAVAAAYWILSQQVQADRDLEIGLRVADVAHEIAGDIAYWRDALAKPTGGKDARPKLNPLVRSLVQRRDRLEAHGIPALQILQFVRQVEAAWTSLQESANSIATRSSDDRERIDWIYLLGVTLYAHEEVTAEWNAQVLPHLEELDAFATKLSAWHVGDPVPALQLPEAGPLVCSAIEIERRIVARGVEVVRDPFAEQLGLYDDQDG